MLLLAAMAPIVALAQDIEFLFADYNHAVYQDGPSSSMPMGELVGWDWASFNFWVGVDVSADVLTGLSLQGPALPGGEPMPWIGDGYELEYTFDTKGEMTGTVTPGSYTFSATSPSFSEGINIPSYNQLPDQLLTSASYTELQAFDASQELTIGWLPFTEGQGDLGGTISIEVSYWDDTGEVPHSVYVFEYETPLVFDDNGLVPATMTSIAIPADTMVGSPYNSYTIVLDFMRVDSLAEASNVTGAMVANVTSTTTVIEAHADLAPPTSWAGYPIVNGGYVDTANWLGWLEVSQAPWVWSNNLNGWMYLPEDHVTGSGSWMYITK